MPKIHKLANKTQPRPGFFARGERGHMRDVKISLDKRPEIGVKLIRTFLEANYTAPGLKRKGMEIDRNYIHH